MKTIKALQVSSILFLLAFLFTTNASAQHIDTGGSAYTAIPALRMA